MFPAVLKNKLLWLLMAAAFFIRFYRVGEYPVALNWDEISHGYNAWSILKTGSDQWGSRLPVFNFRAYGDYPTTLNLYLTIPYIAVFGLNSFSIRLPAVIFGTLFVLFSYLLSRKISRDPHLPYIVALLAAFSPWTFFPSRAVFQSNLSAVLLIGGLYFFLSGFHHPRRFLWAAMFFGLAPYAYHNTRIIIPLLVPILIIFNRKNFPKPTFVHYTSFLLFLLLVVPNFFNLFSPESAARSQWVGIINPNSINLINESRRLYEGPYWLNVLLHNRYLYFLQNFALNYLNLFNPLPLFFTGSQNYQFNPPATGLLFWFLLPFFYFGLVKSWKYLPVTLLCLLPSALTTGDWPSIRATSAVFFYYFFIARGITNFKFYNSFYFKIFLSILFTVFSVNYFLKYRTYLHDYSLAWQDGYPRMVAYLKNNYSRYDSIYVTKKYGEPHEFILFYWPWDPQKYLDDKSKSTNFHSGWYWVDAFDKFKFVNDWEIKNLPLPARSLLVSSPNNPPASIANYLSGIQSVSGIPVFDIYETN